MNDIPNLNFQLLFIAVEKVNVTISREQVTCSCLSRNVGKELPLLAA